MITEGKSACSKGSCFFGGFDKGRPLVLELNGDAFQYNIRQVKELSAPASMMVVLKANAYGHGLIEMALLASDYDLAVAVPEEMRRLRDASISNRIWVLEGPFSVSCIEDSNDVVWVVHSLWQLALFSKVSTETKFNVCLKLDTGMGRLGFNASEFSLALDSVRASDVLNLYACMTHFSASDLPNSELVDSQLQAFDDLVSTVGLSDMLESVANSGGVLFYPQSHRDIVRPGIILYGAMPCPAFSEQQFDLKPVMSFKSAIIAIRNISKGEGVGYGSRWVAQRDSIVATVACGYGDGYPRHAPDGTAVAVFDKDSGRFVRAPLAGRVSMDMLTIDVTDIPSCRVGTEIELWGRYISVDELALAADTIAYELFCGVTERVPRKYCTNVA